MILDRLGHPRNHGPSIYLGRKSPALIATGSNRRTQGMRPGVGAPAYVKPVPGLEGRAPASPASTYLRDPTRAGGRTRPVGARKEAEGALVLDALRTCRIAEAPCSDADIRPVRGESARPPASPAPPPLPTNSAYQPVSIDEAAISGGPRVPLCSSGRKRIVDARPILASSSERDVDVVDVCEFDFEVVGTTSVVFEIRFLDAFGDDFVG